MRTPLPDAEADAAAFEEWRSLLFGIAYRMLGSAADAEDVVQDACVRWLRRRDEPVESVRSYLVTIVTRLCLDQLDSARAERVTYAGPWLPEPVADDEPWAAEQADSLSLAFLVLLEELTPLERAAYLLHDIFGYSFEEVAASLGRSPAACRQLGVRARGHIEERRQRFDADLRHGRELTDRFLAACATGDLSGLLSMLSDDVVVWTDGGGKVRAAMRPVVGPYRSSRFLMNVAKKAAGPPAGGGPQRPAGQRLRAGRRRRGGPRARHHGRDASSGCGWCRTRTSWPASARTCWPTPRPLADGPA